MMIIKRYSACYCRRWNFASDWKSELLTSYVYRVSCSRCGKPRVGFIVYDKSLKNFQFFKDALAYCNIHIERLSRCR